VLLPLGIVVFFPISMLLVLAGAVGAGALAATWFTVSRRRIHHVHRIQVVIKPERKRELIEKIR
jgi:hypothetical protein